MPAIRTSAVQAIAEAKAQAPVQQHQATNCHVRHMHAAPGQAKALSSSADTSTMAVGVGKGCGKLCCTGCWQRVLAKGVGKGCGLPV